MDKINELGNEYGNLMVIAQEESTPAGQSRWLCKCKCGNQIIARGARLRSGYTKQCPVCAALARHKSERDKGIKRLSPFSKEAQIKAWHKRQQREMDEWALNDYYSSL